MTIILILINNEDNIDIDELQFNKIMTNDINKLNEAKKIMDVI